jgi:hypothetical protein
MSDLQNQTPADTYKGLLQVGDYTNGVDANSEYIQDGEGTNSVLSISTTKVGVGTVSPSAELDVNGNVVADEYALDGTGSSSSAVAIHAPATNELAIRTNSTEAMRIDSAGNVGLGTTSPDTVLHISSPQPVIRLTDTSSATDTVSQVWADSDAVGALFLASDITNVGTDPFISFRIGGTGQANEKMRINSDGNVGIGTNSPTAPLEVASTTGGVIMPRMNDSQMNAISSPTDGEMIYNTTDNKFYGRANGAWVALH